MTAPLLPSVFLATGIAVFFAGMMKRHAAIKQRLEFVAAVLVLAAAFALMFEGATI